MKLPNLTKVSSLQVRMLFSLWITIFVVLGANTAFTIYDMKQDYLEAIRWRSEALAQSILYTIDDRDLHTYSTEMLQVFLRGLSLECHRLFELNKDKNVSHFAIIDATGHIAAHNDRTLWGEPITSLVLQKYLNRPETKIVLDDAIYHTLVPMNDKNGRYLGMIDIGFPWSIVDQKIQSILYSAIWLFGLLSCLTGGILLFLSTPIFLPVREVVHAAEMISAGDLRTTIEEQGSGEIRRLTVAFRHMANNLRTMTEQVIRAGSLIKSSTHDILTASNQLAVSLEEQSASVLETSVTMENVVAASQEISESTDAVVQIAQKTRNDAQQGLHIAEDTLKKMQDIEQSNQINVESIQHLGRQSGEISKIMDVIVSIADQTKLISFNASLEAVEAGKAGRRFGVVAKEIRNLADNVIGSTKNIRRTLADIQTSVQNLIISSEASTKNIQEGVEYTKLTAKWLREILNGTDNTTNATQNISASIVGQQCASEGISAALKEISISTDQFAKAGAATHDIAGRLDSLSKELEDSIKVLKL